MATDLMALAAAALFRQPIIAVTLFALGALALNPVIAVNHKSGSNMGAGYSQPFVPDIA